MSDGLCDAGGLSMRRVTALVLLTAVLSAIEVALVLSRTGSVPLPTGLSVTILALPAIAAGILGGVVPGAVVGAAFGGAALSIATTPLFQNPIVALVPRILIGPASAVTYRLLRGANEPAALLAAGAVGPVVGTGLLLLLGTLLNSPVGAPYVAPEAARDVAITNIPSEALLGAVVALAVGLARRAIERVRR